MVNVRFRIPSKMVQYGYVELDVPIEDADVNPVQVARDYIEYVKAFQEAERTKPAETAPAPAPAVVTPPVSVEQSAAQLIESELGGKVVAEETAPWDEDAPPKAEPWKNNSTIEDLFA